MTFDINAVRARCDAAMQGPWTCKREVLTDGGVAFGEMFIVRDASGDILCEDVDDIPTLHFIAHARTDLPAALDEIARLREELAAMQAAEIIAWCVEWISPETGLPMRDAYVVDSVLTSHGARMLALDRSKSRTYSATIYPLTRGGPNV